jgi:hypothetical protein
MTMPWEEQAQWQHDYQHWHQRATENSWPLEAEVDTVCGPEYRMYAYQPQRADWPEIVFP